MEANNIIKGKKLPKHYSPSQKSLPKQIKDEILPNMEEAIQFQAAYNSSLKWGSKFHKKNTQKSPRKVVAELFQ